MNSTKHQSFFVPLAYAKTANAADARVFLDRIGSEEFASILGNELPGFFPLSKAKSR